MTDNLALVIAPILGSLVLYVWIAASLHAVFRKAGEEGWQAWVPVLNVVVLLRLGGFSGWWALLLLVPGLGALALAVVVWIACSRINAAFGMGIGMTLMAILLFPVWSSILGWGSARWLGREQRMPGPLRSASPRELGRRMPAPAYAAPTPPSPAYGAASPAPGMPLSSFAAPAKPAMPYGSGGMPLDNIPPRPAGVPPAPPAGWPASPPPALPAPAVVTQVPSTAPGFPDDADDDEPPAPGFAPRRRADARAADAAIRYADDPAESSESAHYSARSAAPYTGTLPRLIDPGPDGVPAGPRRALPPDPDDIAEDHLVETRDAPPAITPLMSVPSPNGRDPWAPPDDPPAVRTPRYSPAPPDGGFSETSAEVSAVAGAPALGAPMAARSSVSSLRDEPELPDAEGAFDETIIATRRRTPWMLHPPLGKPIAVTSSVLIIGRRPSSDAGFAHAQLVPVTDETRTMSKTHARLELHDDHWTITDLDSTNGVVLLGADGGEFELASGNPQPLTETFLLGDAELRLAREPGLE